MPRLTKKTVLLLGLALVLVAGGVATASNMGFKLNKQYPNADPAINTVALPYFQSQFTTAKSFFDDLGVGFQVCRLEPSGARTCWLGDFTSSPNFSIVNTQGLIVGVTSATTQIIVGSHNPSLNVGATIATADPDVYLVSMPYHMTYANAKSVFDSLGVGFQVCRLESTGARTCWLGDFTSSPNFATVIGEPLVIGVTAGAPSWIPAHY